MNDIEIIELQDISRDEAKKQIISYLKEHKTVYISQLAEQLRLDIELIIDITNELEQEGKIRETPIIT